MNFRLKPTRRVHHVPLRFRFNGRRYDVYKPTTIPARDFVTIRAGGARWLSVRGFNTGRMRENQSPIERTALLRHSSLSSTAKKTGIPMILEPIQLLRREAVE